MTPTLTRAALLAYSHRCHTHHIRRFSTEIVTDCQDCTDMVDQWCREFPGLLTVEEKAHETD